MLIGILGGYRFSRAVHRRFARMTAAADAIIQGDMQRRIPVDDVDQDKVSASFKNGVLTVTGDGVNLESHPDHYYFAGMPWSGDGQWLAAGCNDTHNMRTIAHRDPPAVSLP